MQALTATSSLLYLGGDFTTVSSVARSRVAAVDGRTGALNSWNPNAAGSVSAMTATPDKTRIVLGGRFTHVGGRAAYGMASVGATTGGARTWNATTVIRDAGVYSAITSLTADGDSVYGTGYVYGSGGNFEGTFRSDYLGNLVWMEDCHGDSYSAFPTADVVYAASHAHDCSTVGGFGQSGINYRATAFTRDPQRTLTATTVTRYANFNGQPGPVAAAMVPDPAGRYLHRHDPGRLERHRRQRLRRLWR